MDNNDDEHPPGTLPKSVELDVPAKDLLTRLLQVDPTRRLRSLRTLETIAFFKGFKFKDVREKKLKPNDLLKLHATASSAPKAVADVDEKMDNSNFEMFDDDEEIQI